MNKDKLLGGLYGLLIGDAAGVPYEFKSTLHIPTEAPFPDLDVPAGYRRTYPYLKPGTWSDDGSQALILLESLLKNGGYVGDDFLQKLIAWKDSGYMAVDGLRFDIGTQTNQYLTAHQHNFNIEDDREGTHCGNGGLMRALPIALFFTYEDAAGIAAMQSTVTHPQYLSQIICTMYVDIAIALLEGIPKDEAISNAIEGASFAYAIGWDDTEPFYSIVMQGENRECTGGGYVVDSFWSALQAFRAGTSYETVIKYAIMFGNDTDTTACIAGGLAGIEYGLSGIPESYIQALRGKELLDPIVANLLEYHELS